jgi:hypothetical protein
MPEYGVWLEAGDLGPDAAIARGPLDAPAPEARPEPPRLTWRGTASDRDEARRLARAAWERLYGASPPRGCRSYVLEIGRDDIGYRGA